MTPLSGRRSVSSLRQQAGGGCDSCLLHSVWGPFTGAEGILAAAGGFGPLLASFGSGGQTGPDAAAARLSGPFVRRRLNLRQAASEALGRRRVQPGGRLCSAGGRAGPLTGPTKAGRLDGAARPPQAETRTTSPLAGLKAETRLK